MKEGERTARFEAQVLVHLDSAYNLARWITRDDIGARDAVQDACLQAFVAFDQMHGSNARAWFLAVIRNTCLDLLRKRHGRSVEDEYVEDVHGGENGLNAVAAATPEDLAVRASDAHWLRSCIDGVPRDYREVIVLRELEELTYKEISAIVEIPIGTVMSRLARARDLLQQRMLVAEERSQK